VAGEGQEEPVAVQEAARRLGRSVDAVRAALRRGRLLGFKGNDGEWRVHLPKDEQELDEPGAGTFLRQELDRLRRELEQARDGIETWRRQAEDSRVSVAELQTRAGMLQAALDRAHAERDRLAAELAEARKGWLERLLEAVRRRP
jgi:uncharacterized small protein (DUF1192 family)